MSPAADFIASAPPVTYAHIAKDLHGQLQYLREREDWDALREFLDGHFFAASLTVPELLEECLDEAPDKFLGRHSRRFLTRDLQRIDRPVLSRKTSAFEQWVAAQECPMLRDRLGVLTMRLRHLIFDGRFDLASLVADEAASLLTSSFERAGLEDIASVVLINVASAKLLAGEVAPSIGYCRAASRWAEVYGGHPAGIHARTFLALNHVLADNVSRARETLHYPPRGPKGKPQSRLHIWNTIALLTHSMNELSSGRTDEARSTLARAGFAGLRPNFDSLGEFWWLPVHIIARLALKSEGYGSATTWLRAQINEYFTSATPSSYAGRLLRADLADLLQASGAYAEASEILTEAETGDRIPQVVASRARLHWLRSEGDQLDLLLADVSQFHPNTSVELDLLRIIRKYERAPGHESSASDELLWASIYERGAIAKLALLPKEVREKFLSARDSHLAGLRTPYKRTPAVELKRGERELLTALGEHDSIAELAQRLHLSPHTVKTRLRDMYRKLGVHSKSELYRIKSSALR